MLCEVSFLAHENEAEALSDALMDLGVLSVSVEDADAQSAAEKPLYGEPGLEPTVQAWNRSRLKALVDDGFDFSSALKKAAEELQIECPAIEGSKRVEDLDWVRITQAQFAPTQVSDRLWIVPSWHEPPNKEAINIRLDPGVAFGTGAHPTTHLCLKWIDAHASGKQSLLDYGCGTGILAIAASKVGVAHVAGCDIDSQAVEAATLNAKENQVNALFTLPEGLKGTFDIVVANILANPLKVLAPALLSYVKKGGYIVLSGILEKQAQEIIATYTALEATLSMKVYETKEGWVCIEGRKAS